MNKPKTIELTPSEMKNARGTSVRGDQVKCPYPNTDALNCPTGYRPSGTISDTVNGIPQNIGLICENVEDSGTLTLYCSGYDPSEDSYPQNPYEACPNGNSDKDKTCFYKYNNKVYKGTCAPDQNGQYFCSGATLS